MNPGTWKTEEWLRFAEFVLLAIGGGFGYFGWAREGRDRRREEREEDLDFDDRIKALRTDVDALYGRNKELWMMIQELQEQVRQRDVKIKEQQVQIERQQVQIDERDDVIRIHEKKIKHLEEQLATVQANGASDESPMV